VNSFRRGSPIALFTAAELVSTQADYLEPELSVQLLKSIGSDHARWAQILGNMLLTYPDRPLMLAEVQAGKTELDRPYFKGFPLAQLALNHLSDANSAETLVWQSLLADIAGFTDEPYHPLFAYNSSFVLHSAAAYLCHYRNNSAFLKMVKTALREDLPGSCYLAARLIDEGQKAYLPEAVNRAMEVIRRPAADGDDVSSAIYLVLRYGRDDEHRQIAALAIQFKSTNPDYATFLQRRLDQSNDRRHPI
jgi:hypothetical protein